MRTRTRKSASKIEVKKNEPVIITVRKMRGGLAHVVEDKPNDMVELSLQRTIEEQ